MHIVDGQVHWTDPRSWPWIIYVWLGAVALGQLGRVWKWFQKIRQARWPATQGTIEETQISQPRRQVFSLASRRQSPRYAATVQYSYTVAGSSYGGEYHRNFFTEDEALDFMRDLKGLRVEVHFNPSQPSNSVLPESSIEDVQRIRPPRPQSNQEELVPVDPIPAWLRPFLWLFMTLSAIGLLLSLWVHIGAFFGHTQQGVFWSLHVGIFLVWFPAILVAQRLVGNTNRKDFWKQVLQGSPPWMRYMVYFFFVYALVNFFIFMGNAPAGRSSGSAPASVWRGFSGHWMAFYSAALAILYSGARVSGNTSRCVNGHLMPNFARYCPQCGQPPAKLFPASRA